MANPRFLTLSLLRSKPSLIRYISSSANPNPSDRISAIADDISKLTILETSDLVELLRRKLGVEQMPTLTAVSPGMAVFGGGGCGGAAAAATEVKEEVKEKTAFDVKLEGYDAGAKIKVIKEVRGFTALGLKEAKELVEKAPVVVKAGATKEEAEKIVEKLKEIGAKVVME